MAKARKRKPVTIAGPGRFGIEIEAATVADPFDGTALRVAKNVRVHPLDTMRARGRLTEAQKAAGDRFLAIYDRSQIGGARAIDYSRLKVDVSFSYDGLDEGAAAATSMLADVCREVGRRTYVLLVRVIGQRLAFWDMARRLDGTVDQAEAEHVAWAFGKAIDDLADYFGCAKGAVVKAAPYRREVRPHAGKIEIEVVEGKIRVV